MTKEKNYPLLPGQTHIEPYYTQVPTEEYEALMREVKQLREITAGSRTTIDDIAEIKTLTSEVNALREMNVKLQGEKIKIEEENAELKANQAWISPSDKLPNENQEIEFIFRRKLFDDDDGVRMRVLGVYKQMFLNPQHCIFYASAPGWGPEFLPKEVEYWMPKIPMPKAPEEK